MSVFLAIIGSTLGHGIGGLLLGGLVIVALALKWRTEIVVGIAIVAGAYVATGFVYRAGQDSVREAVERATIAERARIENVNAVAKADEAKYIAWLTASKLGLEKRISENDRDAALDPNANHIGLDVGGVRRLNQIRGGASQARPPR